MLLGGFNLKKTPYVATPLPRQLVESQLRFSTNELIKKTCGFVWCVSCHCQLPGVASVGELTHTGRSEDSVVAEKKPITSVRIHEGHWLTIRLPKTLKKAMAVHLEKCQKHRNHLPF